jgi:SAM-dependent methyltransferase
MGIEETGQSPGSSSCLKYSIMDYYDSIIGSYEELYGDEQLSKYMVAIRPRSLRRVLDIGCGMGLLYRHIVEVLGAAPEIYVGVDISHESLKVFRSRHGGTGIVELVAADMDYPPLRPRIAFTNVYSFTVYTCDYGDITRVKGLIDEEQLEECAVTITCADREPSCPEGFIEIARISRLEVLCAKKVPPGGFEPPTPRSPETFSRVLSQAELRRHQQNDYIEGL